MNKYFKGKKIIFATERAFEVIYKSQGFKKVKDNNESGEVTDDEEEENEEK